MHFRNTRDEIDNKQKRKFICDFLYGSSWQQELILIIGLFSKMNYFVLNLCVRNASLRFSRLRYFSVVKIVWFQVLRDIKIIYVNLNRAFKSNREFKYLSIVAILYEKFSRDIHVISFIQSDLGINYQKKLSILFSSSTTCKRVRPRKYCRLFLSPSSNVMKNEGPHETTGTWDWDTQYLSRIGTYQYGISIGRYIFNGDEGAHII